MIVCISIADEGTGQNIGAVYVDASSEKGVDLLVCPCVKPDPGFKLNTFYSREEALALGGTLVSGPDLEALTQERTTP